MSETKHTPEPWEIAGPYPRVTIGVAVPEEDDPSVGHYGFAPILQLIESAEAYGNCDLVPNAARIVACVNALAGVDDPAAELTRLRELRAACDAWREAGRQAALSEDFDREKWGDLFSNGPNEELIAHTAAMNAKARDVQKACERVMDLIDAMKEPA